ncbi:hypothetical protein DGG96_07345 [Legionella qingyii]|uniref:Uncharacterized protein n=1 Tax=Legionella qingyii TaxID=2184757 RepID=A0A317U3L2_9GAMM|nr:hypothetical protein DGG96_07345 [Legionella qingyii]
MVGVDSVNGQNDLKVSYKNGNVGLAPDNPVLWLVSRELKIDFHDPVFGEHEVTSMLTLRLVDDGLYKLRKREVY